MNTPCRSYTKFHSAADVCFTLHKPWIGATFRFFAAILTHSLWLAASLFVLASVFCLGCLFGYTTALATVADLEAARIASEESKIAVLRKILRHSKDSYLSVAALVNEKYHAGRSAIAWIWWLMSDGAFWLAIPTLTASIRFVFTPLVSVVRWSRRSLR